MLIASPAVCRSCPPSSARQEVCRLYRASLKLLDSWAIDRTIFNEEATKVRASVRACAFLPLLLLRLLLLLLVFVTMSSSFKTVSTGENQRERGPFLSCHQKGADFGCL